MTDVRARLTLTITYHDGHQASGTQYDPACAICAFGPKFEAQVRRTLTEESSSGSPTDCVYDADDPDIGGWRRRR